MKTTYVNRRLRNEWKRSFCILLIRIFLFPWHLVQSLEPISGLVALGVQAKITSIRVSGNEINCRNCQAWKKFRLQQDWNLSLLDTRWGGWGVLTYWTTKPQVGSACLKICLNVKLCNVDHIQLILSFPEKSRTKQWNKTNMEKWRLHQLAYLYFRLEIKSFGKLYSEYLSLKT